MLNFRQDWIRFCKIILHFQKYVNRPCMYAQLLVVLNVVKFRLDLLVRSGSNLPLPIQIVLVNIVLRLLVTWLHV